MPHLILHLSRSLEQEDWRPFFKEAHEFLSQYADVMLCKSRISLLDQVYVGKNTGNEGLVYLELLVKPRPEEMLRLMGDGLFRLLESYAKPLLAKYELKGSPTFNLRLLKDYWP